MPSAIRRMHSRYLGDKAFPKDIRGRKSRALVLSKLEFLRSTFFPITSRAIPIPPERLRAYARRLHRRRLDHAKDLAEPGRTPEVVGFNHTTLAQQADRAVRMLLMAVARTWGQAHDRVRRRVSTGPSDHTALIEELCREAQNDALMSTSTLSVTRFQQGRESQQCLEARYLRRSRRQLPSQTARGDAGCRRRLEPVGEPGDGLEYDEDAVGARPVERPTFHRGAPAPDRAHRPDAHRGHQLAGRVHLPDRAIPGQLLPSLPVAKSRAFGG
jgi:hypothetical protein